MIWPLLVLATILRLPLINQSLWLDEAIEALALQGWYGPILKYALSDFQPPLYHFILMVWTRIAGYSEIALRTPSFIAGIAIVYCVYKIGELLGGRKMATIAGLLTAVNPLLIYYSGEGRTYMMTACFATAAMYYLLKLVDSHRPLAIDHRSYLLFLFSALSIWTSYLAWFFWLSMIIIVIFKKKYRLLVPLGVATLTWIAWIPSLLSSLSLGMRDAANLQVWGQVVGGISLKALALTWIKWTIGRISFENNLVYGIVVGLMFAIHARILTRLRPLTIDHWPFTIWFAVSIAGSALISLFVPAYSYTRVLFALPAFIVLLAYSLSTLTKVWTYIVVAMSLVFVSIYWFTPRFHREEWRAVVAEINAGDGAVAMPSTDQIPPLVYYGIARKVTLPREAFVYQDKRVYYIKYVEEIYDPDRTGHANLVDQGFALSRSITYPGLQLDIYEQ